MMAPLNPLRQNLKRRWKSLAIAAVLIIGLTSIFAPHKGNQILYGSTYGRSPSGYGAWFQYMADQGTPIQRWQRPLSQFIEEQGSPSDRPTTLLQVGNSPIWQGDYAKEQDALEAWLAQGNRLIILKSQGDVTQAPANSQIKTPLGEVVVETRRRNTDEQPNEAPSDTLEVKSQPQPLAYAPQLRSQSLATLTQDSESDPETLESGSITLLADSYGTIVWATAEGKGSYIEAVTPDLGANAYQASPGNFAFLAGLVKANEAQLWVNEYSHGYKDKDPNGDNAVVSWSDYFLGTPLMLAWVQLLVLLAIALVTLNRRWGLPQLLEMPKLNNSEAYINALAGVLRRSGSHDFVLGQWQTAERQRLQRQLGLGNRPVELAALLKSWEQQTGESASLLQSLLSPVSQDTGSISQLKRWLTNLEQVRQLSRKHFS